MRVMRSLPPSEVSAMFDKANGVMTNERTGHLEMADPNDLTNERDSGGRDSKD